MQLDSISNRQLKLLRKLKQKKYRKEQGLFLLEGARAVEQVLQNKITAVKTLFFDGSRRYWQQKKWSSYLTDLGCVTIASSDFVEIADTRNPQGVLALCKIPNEISIDGLSATQGLIIALDGLQDPGNAGTIIRTASWFGAKGIISGKGTVDLFNPKVVRSTAGATGSVPHLNGDLPNLLSKLNSDGWAVHLLEQSNTAVPVSSLKKASSKTVLVVGNEAHGIDNNLSREHYQSVMIPSRNNENMVESLNAAIAASIAMYQMGD